MSVPDHRAVVDRTYASGLYDLTTKVGAGKFTEAAALDLYALDKQFGHLRKPAGRTHVVGPDGNRHAVDVLLYRETGQIIDIISGAGDSDAKLAWGVGPVGEYGPDDWYAPIAASAPPVPEPIPPPVPPVTDLSGVIQRLDDIQHRLDLLILAHEEQVTPPAVTFPDYHADGRITAPWPIGNAPFSVTLKPVKP